MITAHIAGHCMYSTSDSEVISVSSSSVSEDPDAYEVERIVDHRTDYKGRRKFLLKWKGYDDSDNTWEKEEDLNCPELIEKYMKNLETLQNNLQGSGKMRDKPKKILTIKYKFDGVYYKVIYEDGRTEVLPSDELVKIDRTILVKFLEKLCKFPENEILEEEDESE